jgi:hypothetical protein
MLLVFVALAGIPLILIWGRRELVSWQAAAAANRFDSGDKAGGLAALESLARRFPDDEAIVLALAQRQIDAGRFADAAATAGRLASSSSAAFESNPAAGASLLRAVDLEARALTASGNPAVALARLKPALAAITRRIPESESAFVNNLAYQRALADAETGEGIAAMERLFGELEQQPFGDITQLTVDGRTLVAATLLAVESNRYQEVRHLVDLRIDALEAVNERMETELLDRQRAAENALPGRRDTDEPDDRNSGRDEIEATWRANSRELAVMLAVRAFALERTGHPVDTAESARARHAVHRLEHDPNEVLAALPDLRGCIDEVDRHAHLLDTWGLLLMRQGRLDKALNALSIACISAELADHLIAGRLGEHPQAAKDPTESARDRRRSIAVQRMHRSGCLAGLGQEAEANSDLAFVRELGFDPADPKLF